MIGTNQKNYQKGIVAATFAALCWGTATVMSKHALTGVSPGLLLVLQLIPSVGMLWFIVWVRRIRLGTLHQVTPFIWLGLLEPGLAYLLGLIGLTDMKAGGATLIQSSEAIMIVVLSAILLREHPTKRILGLSLLAFVGLIIALGIMNPEEARGNGVFGITLTFAATATAAIYVVLSSRIALKAHPIAIVAWQQSVALIFALLMLPIDALLQKKSLALPTTAELWAIVILSGVVQYALAFSLYMQALRNISANIAGSFLNLTPVFGLVGAFLFLKEKFSLVQLAGATITIASVMVISRSGKARD